MISERYAVLNASRRIVDGDNSRSPSTVSDCYSNDEDFIHHDFKDDEHYFKTNLFSNYESKCGVSLYNSGNISEDEDHRHENTQSLLSTFNAFLSENTNLSILNHLGDNDTSTLLIDHVNSSEYLRVPSRSRESLQGAKICKTNDDSVSITVDSKDYNLESVSSSEVLVQRSAKDNLTDGVVFQPYENTISRSISYHSKWNESQMCHGEEERCMHSEYNYSLDDDLEYKIKPKLVEDVGKIIPIKSVSHYSTKFEVSKERSTQTTSSNSYKEMCIGTDGAIEDLRDDREDPYTNEGSQIMSIDTTMNILKMHIDNLMSNTESKYGSNVPSSLDYVGGNGAYYPVNPNYVYSDRIINDLYIEIKQIYSLLDSKLHPIPIQAKQSKHQRRFSEDVKNRTYVRGDGDIVNDREIESAFFPNDCNVESKINNYYTNCTLTSTHAYENDDWTCRTFELNPYDDLIRSYKSSSDRRIKSVGHKMKCKILISGPIRMFDSTNSCWNIRNKTSYRCSIKGPSKELVEKCLKCLQDTFPQSCLNEKHICGKFERKT